MEPIINPWIFYFMSLADGFRAAGYILAIAGFGAGVISLMLYNMEEGGLLPWKYLKWFVIAFVAGGVMSIFVPSQEVITKMLVASFITPDNIELGVEGVKAIFDYIITTAAELFGPVANGG